jgi:AraC-like DNA-binding protein
MGACGRLLELLDTPEDIPFLSHLIQREIVYRILRTPQAERLRAIATSGDLSQRTTRAIAWLRANFAKPLHMEDLASTARMGVSTLHHQFRALTAMSPLQYQKQLRLQAARERMLMDGLDATSAAYEVGYESVSQFSREYSRFFGQPPLRDIKALRDSNVGSQSCLVKGALELTPDRGNCCVERLLPTTGDVDRRAFCDKTLRRC